MSQYMQGFIAGVFATLFVLSLWFAPANAGPRGDACLEELTELEDELDAVQQELADLDLPVSYRNKNGEGFVSPPSDIAREMSRLKRAIKYKTETCLGIMDMEDRLEKERAAQ